MAMCLIEGCPRMARSRGWCNTHYERWRRTGSATPPRRSRHVEWAHAAASQDTDGCVVPKYRQITFDGHHGVRMYVVVCTLVHGARPERHEVAHSCGSGGPPLECCNPRHLRWARHIDNERDKVAHGTAMRGETHGSAVLTAADVRAIRADDRAPSAIAADFGISAAHARAIQRRLFWRHLE